LLADNVDITKLNISNEFLDEIYDKTNHQIIEKYFDAKLSDFSIIILPFTEKEPSVIIRFSFYSKWADKTCDFAFYSRSSQLKYQGPDESPILDTERCVFSVLPWKKSPNWSQFINLAYLKIRPLTPNSRSNYIIHAFSYQTEFAKWSLTFRDGYNGERFYFLWNGKELSEDNIKRSL
jgi:hypothetical protein